MRCPNRSAIAQQCTLEAGHTGNHAMFCGSGGYTWPRLHMLGAGPIIWRQTVEKHYPGRGLGSSGPFTRAHLETLEPHRCPASREYYRRIDKI